MKIIYTIFFLFIIICILTHSQLSLAYALMGLKLWFESMIPSLLPFMILSGIMIRMNLTKGFCKLFYPIIRPLFQVTENVCYAMIMGFLCGFPMGAKTVAELVKHNMISKQEAEFLLAFCNNIGPVYFCSFVLPLLDRQLLVPYIVGMYGIPMLYGLFLRYTKYKNIAVRQKECITIQDNVAPKILLNEVDDAINSSIQSILSLSGYMILFNLLNIIPHIIVGKTPILIAPLLEISGGLRLTEGRFPLYLLLVLPFGGLSCIAQTNCCIQGTGLSLMRYVMHKLILTIATFGYYLIWFLVSPESFLL